jgi:AbrB family looped-hinge helix DNA binding protein
MRTTIDKAGRVVIPRAIRERAGLGAGGEVEIELDGSIIRLEPVAGTEVIQDGRFLIIPPTGSPLTGAQVRSLIDADRHQRG